MSKKLLVLCQIIVFKKRDRSITFSVAKWSYLFIILSYWILSTTLFLQPMEPCTVGRRQIGLRLNRSVSQTRGRARQRYSGLGLIMLSAAETYGIVRGGLARRRSSLQRGIHGSDAERTRRAAAACMESIRWILSASKRTRNSLLLQPEKGWAYIKTSKDLFYQTKLIYWRWVHIKTKPSFCLVL